MADDNPRPSKRVCIRSDSDSSSPPPTKQTLSPLPPQLLLLSLPAILLHPPTHPLHPLSLSLSLCAVRKCLTLDRLDPDIECRAWAMFAELAINAISSGFHLHADEHPWAQGIEIEAEKAISKGLLLAQKHPSLRLYRLNLALLNAQLSSFQPTTTSKFTRTLLRRLASLLLPTDPPHIVYTSFLATISHLTVASTSTGTTLQSLQDTHAALAAVDDLQARATRNAHQAVVILAYVLRIRILVMAGMWESVGAALRTAEDALGLVYLPSTSQQPAVPSRQSSAVSEDGPCTKFSGAFDAFMMIHTLIFGVVFYTHTGNAAETSKRLQHLHAILDAGALRKAPHGVVNIEFPGSPPLCVQTTHPRVLYLLAFLVSATAKRDPVGRKPRRRVFAMEGLAAWEREVKRELPLTCWASAGNLLEIDDRLVRIKADLLCELVGVSIMRSEFDTAQQTLDLLISHTRTYSIFPTFAARITLYHAHLAHALGRHTRALECYRVAAHLAIDSKAWGIFEQEFVRIAARAGEVALLISTVGIGREGCGDAEEVKRLGKQVVRECQAMGGTLESVGQVLEACLSTEILKSKEHLKKALESASQAQDNHLRALTLALVSAHYLHTAERHARGMLEACEQLATGMGAVGQSERSGSEREKQRNTDASGLGNVPLRLWVGERFHDKRAGNIEEAERRNGANQRLAAAIAGIVGRG